LAPLKNGVGKFNDFTDKALDEIKALGATIFGIQGPTSCRGNYITIGISNDDPDVVKGRAGSPTLLRIITMLILICC
jgi:hypothetical protein